MPDLVAPDAEAPSIAAWNRALAEPNIEDARIAHALAPLARVPGLARVETTYRQRFRLKSWQYMTASSDELFVAFVVGTAGFASNGFCYAVELATGRVHQRFAITPLSLGTELAPSSTHGEHRFATRKLGVAIANHDGGRRFTVQLAASTTEGARISGELELASRAGDDHLAVCVPLPGGRWNYTHKFAAFAVGGALTISSPSTGPSAGRPRDLRAGGGRRFVFDPERAYGTLDFTKMYALRHAIWRWVALAGRSKHGARIGLNLVDPTPDAPVSENALWVDGRCEPVRDVHLISERGGWRVEAASIDLAMRPLARVEQRLDIPLVRHQLRHVVGAFSGHVRTASGHVHDLENVVAIAEDWDTWW
jgi:uncharacterized protein DUF2804